jgi:predicted DNA-binding transcriptional regulator AlpA
MTMTAIVVAKEDDFLTKTELARRLKLSERSVDRHCKAGKIPAPSYVGTRPRWLCATIDQWFRAGLPGGGAPRVMPQRGLANN